MRTAIVVDKSFETIWPFSADRLHQLLSPTVETTFVRLADSDTAWLASVDNPAAVERLILLGRTPTDADLDALPALKEAFVTAGYGPNAAKDALEARGIASLEAHVAYLGDIPGHPAPRDLITGFTSQAGRALGVPNAVLFRVYQLR